MLLAVVDNGFLLTSICLFNLNVIPDYALLGPDENRTDVVTVQIERNVFEDRDPDPVPSTSSYCILTFPEHITKWKSMKVTQILNQNKKKETLKE